MDFVEGMPQCRAAGAEKFGPFAGSRRGLRSVTAGARLTPLRQVQGGSRRSRPASYACLAPLNLTSVGQPADIGMVIDGRQAERGGDRRHWGHESERTMQRVGRLEPRRAMPRPPQRPPAGRSTTSAMPPRMASAASASRGSGISRSHSAPPTAATTGTASWTVAALVARRPRSAVYQMT